MVLSLDKDYKKKNRLVNKNQPIFLTINNPQNQKCDFSAVWL